jgi:hypothetical protein
VFKNKAFRICKKVKKKAKCVKEEEDDDTVFNPLGVGR